MTNTLTRIALVVAFATSLITAQNDGPNNILMLEPSELEMHQYTPKHVSAHGAVNAISSTYGRSYVLPSQGGRAAFNLQAFGETILVIDESEHAQRVLDVLAKIDVPQPEPTFEKHEVHTFTVENISVQSAYRALDVLGNVTYSPIPDAASIVVNATKEKIEQVKNLLAEIDTPAQRILLQCMIVQARQAEVGASLQVPEALSSNLSKLVDYDHFEMVTQGMLTGVAEAGKQLAIEFPANEHPSEINLTLGSFDSDTKSLSLEQCFINMGSQQIRTSAVIRSGEYLVLCATGREPLFAVLRMSTID